MPPVEEWDTFPFDGEMTPRALRPPVEREEPRFGEGGVDCGRCTASDDEYVWTSERWRLLPVGPTGLPLVAMLEPRAHFAEPGDLPDVLAAELGVLLARIERAIRSIGEHRPRPRLPLGRRRRAPPLVVHGAPGPHPAADRKLRRDLGRHPPARARGRCGARTSTPSWRHSRSSLSAWPSRLPTGSTSRTATRRTSSWPPIRSHC